MAFRVRVNKDGLTGLVITNSLFDLMQLAREVGRGENSLTQSRDACLIGKILRALNGEGLTPLCNRTGGAISFTGCN